MYVGSSLKVRVTANDLERFSCAFSKQNNRNNIYSVIYLQRSVVNARDAVPKTLRGTQFPSSARLFSNHIWRFLGFYSWNCNKLYCGRSSGAGVRR